MSTQENSFYGVKNRYSVVVHDVNRVEFRQGVWNPTSTTLTDDSESGKLVSTIELLDGKHTIGEIAKGQVPCSGVTAFSSRLGF
ncbi:hypothetical protein BSZ39_12785 [Bowdeniella nasicola]|uniref:Uncharacterized protein n=1 Tax=Bowdeniella nasicola TaxID=208480 RepID=A0A1Q5PVA8_9ACTO|nr:hypothetical protein [Bowdeniella nasicola]OKL51350.1 hypothetical protein BSZ39_12785 [Bowdeniella nasicola]